MKRLLLIINPISGTLPKDGLAERVTSRLEPEGFTIEVAETEFAGHGAKLAAKAASEGYYGVIAAGGDGTVNEIATALCGSNTALGILPFGSGNGLARHIYGSIDVDRALDVIARDHASRSDYGTANGCPFFCTFGLGFDAKVSEDFAAMSRRGLISYIRGAVREMINFKPTTYEIRSGGHSIKVKAYVVAVCNASQYGNNAYIAPRASIHDGLLDITVLHVGNPLTRAFAGVELFTGRIDKNVLIQTLRVNHATIRHIPGIGHIDGEPISTPQTVRVKCHHSQLLLFTDPEKPPFRPFVTLANALKFDSLYLLRENSRIFIGKIARWISPVFRRIKH